MPTNCEACRSKIEIKQQIKCTSCKQCFHAACVNITSKDLLNDKLKCTWVCPTCRSKERRGDNHNTPVHSPAPHADPENNVTLRHKRGSSPRSPMEYDLSVLDTLVTEIRFLRSDIGTLQGQLKTTSDSIASCNKRMDGFDTRLKSVEDMKPSYEELEGKVDMLQGLIQTQAQASLRNELEIVGITESKHENLLHMTLVIARKLSLDLEERDIDWVRRVGPQANKQQEARAPRPRPVVIRLLRSFKRDEFLNAARVRRSLTSVDFEVEGPSVKLYFNERLTKQGREFFREARSRCQQNKYKFCWIKNGMVHIRKEDGKPAVALRNRTDLDRHLQHIIV